MTTHYRQGDLLIQKIDKIPTGVKKDPTGIILYGEATGHKHQLFEDDVFRKGDKIFLVVAKKGEIRHEEHNTIKLSAGKYAVVRQREYTSGDMVKLVVD